MGTLLHDAPLIEHDQPIHSGDGGQTMGDGDYGFAFHQLVQAFLNCIFYLGVERAGGMTRAMAMR